MKQNTFWFFMAAILCVFGLFGVVYGIPYMPTGRYSADIDWDLLNKRLNNDMGHEMFLPNFSLFIFLICAIIYAATMRFRAFIFVLSLLNVLYVIAIPTLMKVFYPSPSDCAKTHGYFVENHSAYKLQQSTYQLSYLVLKD